MDTVNRSHMFHNAFKRMYCSHVVSSNVFEFHWIWILVLATAVTIRYDTRCYFNVRSKADISQLNLPHGDHQILLLALANRFTEDSYTTQDHVQYYFHET